MLYHLWLMDLALLVTGVVASLVACLLPVVGSRLVAGNPRSLTSLRVSMAATAAAVVVVGALMLWLAVRLLGYSVGLIWLVGFVAAMGFLQWLVSPYIINAIYHVHEAGPELEWLRLEVERLARMSGLRSPPKLVVAEIGVPNAFAYGNPVTGYYVAVTRELLRIMPREEVVAVVGHEIGHIRHRDVQAILALSLVPAIAYFLGRLLIYYGMFSGGSSDREERQSPLLLLALGIVLVVVSVAVHFLIRHFNRLREYYADAHSALVVGSARPLQRALARLHLAYTRPDYRRRLQEHSSAAMLFIVSYLVDMLGGAVYDIDAVVEQLKREETNPIEEFLSTHPPVPKRIRFLDEVEKTLAQYHL